MTSTLEYRNLHQDRAHAERYEREMWSPDGARALDWELEQRLLDRIFAGDLRAPVRSALDFACGTGRVLGYLESRVPVTFGVDISAEMVELARPRCGRSRFYLQDVLQPPRADLPADLDLITAFRFFLNAEPELRRAALRFMHGRLRPTGALVANFHLNPLSLRGRYLRARWHGRRREPMLSPADVERLLAAERFEPVAWYGYEYLPYRRAGERMIAPRLRRQVETWLLDRTAVRGHAGSFLVVARPR